MISRELKLKPTKKQERLLREQLFQCSGLYNVVSQRIKLYAKDKIYYSKYELFNQFVGHSKKTDLHSRTIQGVIERVYLAWDRCFKRLSKEPRLKSVRNKMNSIPFPDPIKNEAFHKKNRVRIPSLGSLKYYKQDLPTGSIKQATIIKRASGWHLCLVIDANNAFSVKESQECVGIDTGFKDIVTLNNGVKYLNQRNFNKAQKRLAQAQRGKNKKLVARLHERIRNKRKDYNHKVSREIVQNYKQIFITNDNLIGQKKKFGKSVNDAGIYQLKTFLLYKSDVHNRVCTLVESNNTTKTCSKCGARNGPTGLNGLAVRYWDCSACGAHHDRDVNSAKNILNIGLGISLVQFQTG